MDFQFYRKLNRVLGKATQCWCWVLVSVAVVVAAGVWGLERWRPGFFFMDDNASFYFPYYLHNYRALTEEGTLALFNFYQYAGIPHMEQGQTGVFYVPAYVSFWVAEHWLGRVSEAMMVLTAFHLVLAGWGLVWMCKDMRIKWWLAGLGCVWWLSLPFVVSSLRFWTMYGQLYMVLPWNFLFWRRWITYGGGKNWVGLAGVKLILLSGGYVQWLVMMGLFEIAYLVFLVVGGGGGWKSRLAKLQKKIWGWLGIYGWLFFTGAPMLWPMISSWSHSVLRRGWSSVGDFMGWYVDGQALVWAQLFRFRDYTQRSIFLFNSAVFYISLPVLVWWVMAVASRWSGGRRGNGSQLWLDLSVVALLLSTILGVILYPVPVLNSFRYLVKYFAFFLFFLSLSLIGWLEDTIKKRKWQEVLVVVGWGVLVATNLKVLITDVAIPGVAWMNTVITDMVEPEMLKVMKKQGRIVAYKTYDSIATPWSEYLAMNYTTWFKRFGLRGYYIFLPKENYEASLVSEEMGVVDMWGGFNRTLDQLGLDHLSTWGVGYVVTGSDRDLSQFPQLKQIWENKDLVVYENVEAKPLVYWKSNEDQRVDYEIKTNRVVVKTGGRSGELVVNVVAHKQFEARVDGQRQVWDRNNMGQIVVDVGEGTGVVELVYRDKWLEKGVASALMVNAALTGWWWRRRKPRVGDGADSKD